MYYVIIAQNNEVYVVVGSQQRIYEMKGKISRGIFI